MSRWPCMGLDPSGTQIARPPRLVTGAESVLTRIQIRLQQLRGNWPDDVALGLPLDRLRMGLLSAVEIEGLVRAQVRRVDGVVQIRSVTVTPGESTSIAVVVDVLDDDGSTVTANVGGVSDGVSRSVGSWYTLIAGSSPVMPR